MDGPCASSCNCQTLRKPRSSRITGIRKQTISLPLLHRGALGLWFPVSHRFLSGPGGCRRGALQCTVYHYLTAAVTSVPHECLSRAPNSASHKINLMPSGTIFLGLCLPWCLCVLVPAITPGHEKSSSLCAPSPLPTLGQLMWREQETVPLSLLQKLPESVRDRKLSRMDFAPNQLGTVF